MPVEPMFYIFRSGGKKLVLITDTGYVSDRMKGTIANAEMYVFESNHDIQMLANGQISMEHQAQDIKRCGARL